VHEEKLVDAREGNSWDTVSATYLGYDPDDGFCECYCTGQGHVHSGPLETTEAKKGEREEGSKEMETK
jgi:hypothetical protein